MYFKFQITLTRWCPEKGERRHNASCRNFGGFNEAYIAASLMVKAAAEADPSREYKIKSVEQNDFGGITCWDGWISDEEPEL